MACQFSATWRTLTNDSASQVSSHLSNNPSMFHFFSTVPISQSKRQRFITFSLDRSSDSSSPSSSSCCTSQSTSLRQIRTKNSHEFERTHYGIFNSNHGTDSNTLEKKETEAHKQNFSYMGLKPFARNEPFSRKILRASKKFRSIILLNVIAVVYADHDKFIISHPCSAGDAESKTTRWQLFQHKHATPTRLTPLAFINPTTPRPSLHNSTLHIHNKQRDSKVI